MERDDWVTIAIVAAVLVASTGAIYAVTQTYPVGAGSHWETDSGLTVETGEDINVESGNPFNSNNSITLQNINLSGQSAAARVEQFNSSQSGQTWTNTSQINVTKGEFVISRPESSASAMGVTGSVDKLRVHDDPNFSENNVDVDLYVESGSTWTLRVENTGLPQGKGLAVVEANSGTVLESDAVEANGTAILRGIEPTNGPLNLRVGPSELKVFKASQPSKLVKDASLQIRFIEQGSENAIQREVTNGVASLDGVPKDERVTITVDENDNSDLVYRRTTLKSVTEQSEVYLLNRSIADVANVVFELNDKSGEFPSDSTTLFVRQPIKKDFDGDGTEETKYQTIVGDSFGTGEFPTRLETDERYKLVVQNENGDRRVMGSYVAQVSDRAVVEIGEVGIDIPSQKGYAADLRTFRQDTDNDNTDEQFVRVVYNDGDDRTEQLEYNVTDRGNNNVVVHNTATGPLGKHVDTFQVNSSAKNTTYELQFEAVREQPDGTDETITGSKYAGDIPGIAGSLPIDPRWLTLIGYVAIVAVAGFVVIIDTVLGALAATGTASLLTILGIVSIPMPALGLAGAISVSALIGRSG